MDVVERASDRGTPNLIRIYLLLLGGIPVCTGIVVFAIGFSGYEILAADAFAPRSDLWGTWIFGGPALVVLLICLRAWRRVAKSDASGPFVLLARLVPVLMGVGVIGGIWATRGIIHSALANRLESEKSLCGDVLSYKEGSRDWMGGPDSKTLEVCLPAAHLCDQERRKAEAKKEDGWNVHPDRDQRPEVICLRKAGRAGGWLK